MERFITDVMLGRLSRWLRVLGYDTRSDLGEDDEILQAARAESRMILTRDRGLVGKAHRMGVACQFVGPPDLESQLLAVFGGLGMTRLELSPERSRCAVCNGELDAVSSDDVRDLVPEKVLEYHADFWRCRGCSKIYWMGRHWDNIEKQINDLTARFRGATDDNGNQPG